MADLIARLGNRRCPDCRAVQPLYVALTPNSRHTFLRDGRAVVPCPGCGLPLRLLDARVDPHGIFAALVLVVLFTGGVLLMIPVSARAGWSAGAFALAMVPAVIGFVLVAMGWSILRVRTREILRADTAPPDVTNSTETPR